LIVSKTYTFDLTISIDLNALHAWKHKPFFSQNYNRRMEGSGAALWRHITD